MIPKWKDGVRVIGLPGLRPFYGSEGPYAEVDAGIADIIRMLNDLGCETVVSCSGLDEDHREAFTHTRAYIGWRGSLKPVIRRTFELAGFTIDGQAARLYGGLKSDVYTPPPSNEHNEQCWESLRSLLRLLLSRSTCAGSSPSEPA